MGVITDDNAVGSFANHYSKPRSKTCSRASGQPRLPTAEKECRNALRYKLWPAFLAVGSEKVGPVRAAINLPRWLSLRVNTPPRMYTQKTACGQICQKHPRRDRSSKPECVRLEKALRAETYSQDEMQVSV